MKDKDQRNSLWLIFYYLVFSACFIFFLPSSVYFNPFSNHEKVCQVSIKQDLGLSGSMQFIDAFQKKIFPSCAHRNPKGVQEKRYFVIPSLFHTSVDRISTLSDQDVRFKLPQRFISFFGHGHRLVIFFGSLRV